MSDAGPRTWLLPWALLLTGALGCDAPPDVVPVTGQLKLRGHSPEQISIVFVPTSGSAMPDWRAHGVTNDAGAFELKCVDGRTGAVPGRYRVMLDDLKVYANPRNSVPPKERAETFVASRIPKTYRTVGTTPLEVEVAPGQEQIILRVER